MKKKFSAVNVKQKIRLLDNKMNKPAGYILQKTYFVAREEKYPENAAILVWYTVKHDQEAVDCLYCWGVFAAFI